LFLETVKNKEIAMIRPLEALIQVVLLGVSDYSFHL